MTESEILSNLKAAFEAAPKTSRGFVNYRRASKIATKYVRELIDIEVPDAYEKVNEIWKPFDAHFHKVTVTIRDRLI